MTLVYPACADTDSVGCVCLSDLVITAVHLGLIRGAIYILNQPAATGSEML